MVSPPHKSLFSEPKRFKEHVSNTNAPKRGPRGDFGPSKCLQGRRRNDFCPRRLPKGSLRGAGAASKSTFFSTLGPSRGQRGPREPQGSILGAFLMDFGSCFNGF